MKIKSIKLSIMWSFFISMLLAAIITFAIFIMAFGSIHIVSEEAYSKVLNLCNKNTNTMMLTSAMIVAVFAASTIVVFGFKLNAITDYITKISENIHTLAEGNFSEKLPLENENELGNLAKDINSMSDKIDDLIKKEKTWNEERYNIITNMSHDLKTPIMSIDGYIGLIKEKKYADAEELNSFCEIISRKSQELNGAINQLFELSKLNSSEFKINKIKINLKEFVEQVVITYIPQFEEHNMTYQILIESDQYVNIDPTLMRRVFENLLTNAVKYASIGKKITIKAEKKDNQITIHFINYGPMIPQSDIDHIFNKYYREKKNTENEGNGLGLAIVNTIMQLHNGSISVDSNKERTDFLVILE